MGEEPKAAQQPAEAPQQPGKVTVGGGQSQNNKMWLIVGIVVGVIILLGGAFVLYKSMHKNEKKVVVVDNKTLVTGQFATDPVERGKYLSHNNCTGTGSKQLGSFPMNPADLSLIEPYGLMAGGHVTPVDHQYYWGKNQAAGPDTYNVLAPADGTIVNVEYRNHNNPAAAIKGDYRVVISYSCTFFSYFDLATSLAPEIASQMPSGFESKNGPQAVKIPVKKGQVVAKMGGQSLDYAVWDTTKTLKGLLVPTAFNNTEPWKIATVHPLDYYTSEVKNALLPLYVRTVEPRDGTIDYDVDGRAVGDWFKKGTNGYIGAFKESEYNPQTYADGHLALAPNFIDPTGWVFSTGAVNHGTQYAIKAPSTTPDKVQISSGKVKYELAQMDYADQSGAKWLGQGVAPGVHMTAGNTQGTALVQLTAKRELKVELFLGKTPDQVTDFTSNAVLYTRGDEATQMAGPGQ